MSNIAYICGLEFTTCYKVFSGACVVLGVVLGVELGWVGLNQVGLG